MTRDLSRLLRPQSVAVVGGGEWCRAVVRGLKDMGFVWDIWPVHPQAETIEGLRAFADLADLPKPPDAVFLGINASATVSAVRALSQMGAGGAICFAAGFSETGEGVQLQADLVDAAGEMPIVGPNCYGLINALDRVPLWPDIHGLRPVPRGVGILAQSSNVALNLTMQQRGLPIAYVATLGNQAQTGLADMAEAMLDDDRVTALGLYVEGFGDLRKLEALALSAQRHGKPVVVLKTGSSDAAQSAALSHTAALCGSDAGAQALCDRLGFARVTTLDGFLEALKLLHLIGPLPANQIAALSCSGGEASLVADAADRRGLDFAPLSALQSERLGSALGPRVALANPLDYNTYIWGDEDAMTRVYAAMMQGGAVITLLIADFPRPDRCPAPGWEVLIAAATQAHAQIGMPLAIVASLPDTMPEARALSLIEAGLIPLAGLEAALDAVAAAVRLGRPQNIAEPLALPTPSGPPLTLTEAEAKARLQAFGLAVPWSCEARDATQAIAAAEGHWPVVLKTTGAVHKSDTGGVVLDLQDADALIRAAGTIGPGPYLVEEMLAPGVELLLGVLADPAHGFVLTLGQGGVLSELAQDVTHLLVPATRAEVSAALDRLRLAPLFDGYRGRAPICRDAVLDAVMALQDYVVAHAHDLAEVEVNPLIVTETSAIAADALITIKEPPP